MREMVPYGYEFEDEGITGMVPYGYEFEDEEKPIEGERRKRQPMPERREVERLSPWEIRHLGRLEEERKEHEENIERAKGVAKAYRAARLADSFLSRISKESEDIYKGAYGRHLEDFAEAADEEKKQRIYLRLIRSIMAHGFSQKVAEKKAYAMLLDRDLI